ncbi:YkgJ family cysteine cluster protein [Desulfonatronovibrio magnus]|uniref:YkgJ family cysteine cluster protein n=1 Tax=Desulfonatronovibrio magnus TaxID=698827 RepID=UPI0005EBBA06|nr:YkgJ family cysteine cluster protein [Desulfonatronovibrio magnus]RQD61815.1 MAG: YkgJ family cysteine cluster protein [Desulfonatronovibrio sp. MSAO_Bac4]
MDLGTDLSRYFKAYEDLQKRTDDLFLQMKKNFSAEVQCDNGCTECCYALFDLPLVEALYLNSRFQDVESSVRHQILIEADKADRKLHKIKKKLAQYHHDGADARDVLLKASKEKVQCPLLFDGRCAMYQHRPVTCRLYGIPLNTEYGVAACALSGFTQGKQYPTVHMQKLYQELMALSEEIAVSINSRYSQLHTMLVPVSMCLLTEYTKRYLGVKEKPEKPDNNAPTKEWVLGPRED